MIRSAQSLLFGPRRAPQLRPPSSLSESEARHLVHLRGPSWARRQAEQFDRSGDSWSAALLRATILVAARRDTPVLAPTAEWILHKFTVGEDRARLTKRRAMHQGSGPELMAYLFPAMPGEKSVERFVRLIDSRPEPTLLSMASNLLIEGCPEEELMPELMRRRSLTAFHRRSSDLEIIESWMTNRPANLTAPHWWHIVCQTAFSYQVDRRVLSASLADADVVAGLAAQLGSDEIGVAAMLANHFYRYSH